MHSKPLIIATAGHVDHGKTSLVNRITGTDTDTLAEEKQRGLTINLGFAYHHFEKSIEGNNCLCTLGFVDVPGHIDFINNMLVGVGSVDFALLVIAADDGIMPQTREHLSIIKLLGIKQGAVALTKTDRVEPEQITQLQVEIENLLLDSELEDPPIFPVSNQTGDGIDELVAHLKSVLINKADAEHASANKNFKFLVDRAFSVKGIGTVVTGSTRAGSATKDSEMLCTSNGQSVRLRGLRLHEENIESIGSGERAALNIDLDLSAVSRGDWLVEPSIYRPITRFDATLNLLDPDSDIKPNAEYHLFLGASHHIVNLRYLDNDNKRFIQVKTNEALIAHQGDRFIVRDPAAEYTLGGGQVIDTFVPRKKRSSKQRLEVLKAMCASDKSALRSLTEISSEGINLNQLRLNRNLKRNCLDQLISSLSEEANSCVKLQLKTNGIEVLLHQKYFDDYRQQILKQILEFHRINPSQQGISEPALSRSVKFSGSHYLFNALLQSLIDEQLVKRTGTLLHKPDHLMSLSKEEEEFLAKIKPILEKSGNVPPRTRELVDLTGISLKPLERILRQTTKAGSLIQVAENRHYLPETIMALAEFTAQLVGTNLTEEGFSVIQFRDESGIGRNLCIEILEYFDRVGFTRRDGNARFLRTEKENIFGI
ncbi:MAG: selenocysteine-specific translation elongation factor [Pseudomonadales bacterium]|nr:selenocysteine-specific translation elongation factor [Pseudomonadales bacterium]